MKKIIILLLFFILFAPAQSYSFIHNEKLRYTPKIKDITIFTEVDHRYDGNDIFYRHYDAGIRFPLVFLGKGWSGGLHYRFIYEKSDDGSWDLEKRPHGQIQKIFYTSPVSWIPEIEWGLRTRHEYRIRENGDDTARNRLRVRLKSNQPYFTVKPFISNEVFYDFDKERFTQNRIDLGIDLPEIKGTQSSIYYKLVTDLDYDDKLVHTSSIVVEWEF